MTENDHSKGPEDFLEFLKAVTKGRGQVITGGSPEDLINNLKKALSDSDCGNAECPVHGDPFDVQDRQPQEWPKQVNFTKAQLFDLSESAAAQAHLLIDDGDWYKAQVAQRQAGIWLRLMVAGNRRKAKRKLKRSRRLAESLAEQRDRLTLQVEVLQKQADTLRAANDSLLDRLGKTGD